MGVIKDLTGRKFGRLTVTGITSKRTDRCVVWHCVCVCGCEKDICSRDLLSGKTKSCGCFMRESLGVSRTTHHKSKDALYRRWMGMKMRCFNPNNIDYKYYGGRGITVCKEWKNDFQAFCDWALSNGYDANAEYGKCTIDRIDVDGNYSPDNCRFVDMKVQANNKRRNKNE